VDDTGAYIDHAGQTWRIGDLEGTYAIPATTASKHTALLGGEAQALVGDGEDVADFWEYRADHREFFTDWRIFEVDPASQTLIEIPTGTSGQADDGPNVLQGDAQDNDLFGLGGADELRGNGGNDALDGGPGDDTAVFSGPQSAYTVRITPSGQTVEDRRPGNDGTDTLARIETLSFSGAEWQLEIFSGVGSLTEQAFRDFVEVYIAYFNRAPDAEGLFFYGTAFANGTSLEASAQTFVDSPEYAATYPAGLSNLGFATEVYKNVLGRDPDQPGLDFWVPLLDSGAVTKGFFIVEVLEGAKAPIPPDAVPAFRDQKLLDQAYLANKTDIGVYFAVTKGMSDVGNATSAMQTFGDQVVSDVSGAVAAIDGFHADALDPETGEFLLELVGVIDDPFAA